MVHRTPGSPKSPTTPEPIPTPTSACHLTLTSEMENLPLGSVASKDEVPQPPRSLRDLWPDTRLNPSALLKADEAEREIRACQIERAIAAGIHPTHLDSHMGTLFSRPDLFAVYVKVAREYKLPFLAFIAPNTPAELSSLLSSKDVLINSVIIADPSVHAGDWNAFYANAIKNLKPGVTEIIVHLGHDDAELQAVTIDHADYGSAWRQRDYNVITSPEFKKLLEDNHVILIHWNDLKKLVQ